MFLLKKPSPCFSMKMRFSSMMNTIPCRKIVLLCSVSVFVHESLLYVTVSEKQGTSFELFLLGKQLKLKANIILGEAMKAEYDFSKMKSRKNPYASKLKKQVTIRMGEDVIEYFKAMAEETGIPYQSLINLYLRDCVAKNRKVNINWIKRA